MSTETQIVSSAGRILRGVPVLIRRPVEQPVEKRAPACAIAVTALPRTLARALDIA